MMGWHAETVSKYVLGDRSETSVTSSLLASQEVNPNPTFHTSNSPNLTFSRTNDCTSREAVSRQETRLPFPIMT